MSHPDYSISLVLGLPNSSVFLNLSRPSFPQRMQVVLHARKQLSVKIISLAHNAFLLGTVCYHAVIMAGQCASRKFKYRSDHLGSLCALQFFKISFNL